MPRHRRLVTFSTTGCVALLTALIVSGILAAGVGGETVRQGELQVSFGGSVAPKALPRTGTTPIAVTVRGRVRSLSGAPPPSLRRITIEVNRLGVLDRRGLPVCPAARLRSSSTEAALAACGRAVVGEGRVGGVLVLPEQEPSPFDGRVVAFNATLANGRPAILAHLFALHPVPLTFLLPFTISSGHGAFGTRLVATVPARTRATAHITSFTLRLHRVFNVGGRRRSYLSAGCPAPPGFPRVSFPLVRTSYGFVGEQAVSETLVRSCRVAAG
jgi:hypothetical protein